MILDSPAFSAGLLGYIGGKDEKNEENRKIMFAKFANIKKM